LLSRRLLSGLSASKLRKPLLLSRRLRVGCRRVSGHGACIKPGSIAASAASAISSEAPTKLIVPFAAYIETALFVRFFK
jgi:hypothetical protein